jgi:hypothetical protein
MSRTGKRIRLGWREWVALPELGVERIKVKIDTGAKTSALHVSHVEYLTKQGQQLVRFIIHPLQRNDKEAIVAVAPLHDRRLVRSSSGHHSHRPVILTTLYLAGRSWPIEVTLVNRDVMGFRMLLGREALRKRCIVYADRSFIIDI